MTDRRVARRRPVLIGGVIGRSALYSGKLDAYLSINCATCISMNYWSMRRKKPLHYNDRIVLRAALAALKGRDLRGRAVALRTLLRLARDYPRLNIEAANQGRDQSD